MKNIYLIAFLGILILLSSCKKELPLPEVFDQTLLVVNSLFSPSNELVVHVSTSCNIQDSNCSDTHFKEAEVFLKDSNGQILDELTHSVNGIYTSQNFDVLSNSNYFLEVNDLNSKLPSVQSKTNVPHEVECNFISIEQEFLDGNLTWVFDIEIIDNADEENYYIIEGFFDGNYDSGTESELNGYLEPIFSHYSEDNNAENKELYLALDFASYGLRGVYLPDANFNGETYKTKVGIRAFDNNGNSTLPVNAILKVKSVSKDKYEYIKSLELLRLRLGGEFSEPQQVYTNIDNGLGIFAGYTEREFIVELPPSEYALPSSFDIENEGCTGPCTVKFSAEGGSKVNYNWSFGDGSTSTEASPEHTYQVAGTYLVSFDASIQAGSGDSWGSSWTRDIIIK